MSTEEGVSEEVTIEDVLRRDVEESRAKCGDLPKLFTELVIARMLESGYEVTPRKVMYILAMALFTKPDTEDLVEVIDVHPLAKCFGYRILHEPAYSQVVIEAIKELWREGRIEVKLEPVLGSNEVRQVIVRGRRFRSSKRVLKEIMRRTRKHRGVIDKVVDLLMLLINSIRDWVGGWLGGLGWRSQ